MGYVHRDIKPENILLDYKKDIYLSDFGFTINKSDPDFLKFTRVGTNEYYPQEMLLNRHYDERADIWCLGILLCELLSGKTPFIDSSPEETTRRIKQLDFTSINNPNNLTNLS